MTLAYTSCIRLVVLWYRASHTFRQYRFAFPLHKYGAMSRLGTARAIRHMEGITAHTLLWASVYAFPLYASWINQATVYCMVTALGHIRLICF